MSQLELRHEPYESQTDRSGSQTAFDELFEAYHRKVFKIAYRLTLQYDDAQDIAQVVFLRASQAFSTFVPSRSIGGWLTTVTHNCAMDELRRRKRSQDVCVSIAAECSTRVLDAVDTTANVELIQLAFASVPLKYRVPLELFYFRDLSYTDISATLDLPLNTVKTHISRGRNHLKREIAMLGS